MNSIAKTGFSGICSITLALLLIGCGGTRDNNTPWDGNTGDGADVVSTVDSDGDTISDSDEGRSEAADTDGDTVQDYLDDGHGSCLLQRPENAEAARGALLFFHGARCWTGDVVVMPNHLHGIVWIVPTDEGSGGEAGAPGHRVGAHGRAPLRRSARSLGSFVAGYKSSVTKRINQLRASPGQPVWQRNYWERVIRYERELGGLREYIASNPLSWELDRLHPGSSA